MAIHSFIFVQSVFDIFDLHPKLTKNCYLELREKRYTNITWENKKYFYTNSVTFCDTFNQPIECVFCHLTVTNCSTSRLLNT